MEDTERNLEYELENAQKTLNASQSRRSDGDSKTTAETGDDIASSKKAILDKLEEAENRIQVNGSSSSRFREKMGRKDNALSQPFPAQREKILDKQYHSLIEQLGSKIGRSRRRSW
ncbi:hypothetical protein ABKV19_010309 [Rosa sericea]